MTEPQKPAGAAAEGPQNENGGSVRDLATGIGISRVSIGGVERIDPDEFFIAPREVTTGEAEAWRAGWRAARDAAVMAVVMIRCEASEYDADGPEGDIVGRWRAQGEADAAFRIQNAIRAMDPPA